MKLLFLKDCTIQAYYDWYCGDGCCRWEDYDHISVEAGETLILNPSGYRNGDYELAGKYHDNECEEEDRPLYVYAYTIKDWLADEFCEILED